MTLDALLLEKLANPRSQPTPGSVVVDHDASGWRVQLSLVAADQIGVRVQSLEFLRLRPLDSAVPLEQQVQMLAQRVTGLLEPLRPLEMDVSGQVAQLRSATPERNPQGIRYYEMLRHADGTTRLHRYQANGSQRTALDFTLTHEALAKLTRDVAN